MPTTALHHFVPVAKQSQISVSAYFCETPSCEVAYFDAMESVVLATELTTPVFPKNLSASLCGCFGLTEDDIWQDIDDGTPTRIRDLLQRSKTAEAHCGSADPQGTCCLPRVQKHYFRLKKNQG